MGFTSEKSSHIRDNGDHTVYPLFTHVQRRITRAMMQPSNPEFKTQLKQLFGLHPKNSTK